MLHLVLHFVVPALIAGLFFRTRWTIAYLIMMATMLVDLDHLLAQPIYDAERCSIGFHPLHKVWWFVLYGACCCFRKTRLVGLGLSTHMVLDAIDCQVTNGIWAVE